MKKLYAILLPFLHSSLLICSAANFDIDDLRAAGAAIHALDARTHHATHSSILPATPIHCRVGLWGTLSHHATELRKQRAMQYVYDNQTLPLATFFITTLSREKAVLQTTHCESKASCEINVSRLSTAKALSLHQPTYKVKIAPLGWKPYEYLIAPEENWDFLDRRRKMPNLFPEHLEHYILWNATHANPERFPGEPILQTVKVWTLQCKLVPD